MKGRRTALPQQPQNPLRTIVGKDPNFDFQSSLDQMMMKPVTLQSAINPPQPRIAPVPQQTQAPILEQPKTGGQKREEIKQEILPEKQEQQELLGADTKKNLRDAGIIIAGALASFGAGLTGQSQQAAAQQMYANLDRAAASDLDKKLSDPDSEESKRARELGQELYGNKIKIKPNMSAKEFMQSSPYFERIYARKLQEQMARAKSMTPKASDSKIKNEYREHLRAVDDTIEQAKLIKQLGRSAGGSLIPDVNPKTKALVTAINSQSVNQARAMAGPGTFSDSDRQFYLGLTANADEASGTALEKIKTNVASGMNTTMRKLDSDLRSGVIAPQDYDRLVAEYDNRLRAFGLALDDNNQVVQARRK